MDAFILKIKKKIKMTKNYECLKEFRRNQSLALEMIEQHGKWKRENEHCTNRRSVSGYSMDEMWSQEPFQRSKSDANVCLTKGQYQFLYGSPKKAPLLVQPNPEGFPISELIKPVSCWLHVREKRIERFQQTIAFLYCDFPVEWDKVTEGYPFSLITRHKFQSTLDLNELFHLNSSFIYLFQWNESLTTPYPKTYKKEQIRSIQLVGFQYQSLVRPMEYDPQLFDSIRKVLRNYLQGHSLSIKLSDLNKIRALNLKLPNKIIAYRGLLLRETEMVTLSLMEVKKGQSYKYVPKHSTQLSSWTTDLCVAQYFATHSIMMGISNRSSILRFGVIFKTELDPSQILLDTRLLAIEDHKELRSKSQSEIIVDRIPKKKSIACTIEELWMQRNGYLLPVQSFSKILQIMQNEKI